MNQPVITVQNLGKDYVIRHQSHESGYRTLRDTLGGLFRPSAIRNPAGSVGPSPHGEKSEIFHALRDVSFEVQQGEVLGIIGHNGAGKSTLLKILSRITEPTRGRVHLRGRVASLLEVGTGFHPELTGRENIFLNGAILGMARPEIRSRFDEIVDFSGVEKFLDTPVKRYSSGMYVRLAFAVAAHLQPDILVIDEVLAVGDAQFQEKCLGKVRGNARSGQTVLFVSHNMSAVRGLCGRALLLKEGRVAVSGTPAEVTETYLSETHHTSALAFATSDLPRPGHFGERLRIEHIEFNKGRGLWHGCPLEVVIRFRCLAPVEGVSLGVGFCSRDGTRVMSVDSDIPGSRWNLQTGQTGTAVFSIDALHLEPDTYVLDLGSRSGDGYGLDYLPQCLWVTVQPSEATPAVIAMRQDGRGGFRQPASWTLYTDGFRS